MNKSETLKEIAISVIAGVVVAVFAYWLNRKDR
ncbi:type I toxin-antitoxin system Fst family toxin [Lactococcus hodotermopsidis]|nr:type I toxin-antitoxin system Fst family toxin [Lactococcus hodotermopsidis]